MLQKRGGRQVHSRENKYSRHVDVYTEMSYLLALTLGGVRGGICELFLLVIAVGEIRSGQTAQRQREETNGYHEDRRTSQLIN